MENKFNLQLAKNTFLTFFSDGDSFSTVRDIEPSPYPYGVVVGYSLIHHSSDQPRKFVSFKLPEISPPRKLIPEQKETCNRAIHALLNTAGEQNWDGEGADPVTENTIMIAQGIVEELPGDVGIPEISADPEGCVEFDWHLDNGTMFTISIGQAGDIAISGLWNGEAKLTGMQWDRRGKIDLLLQSGLEWLRGMQENDNRI